MLTYLQVFCLFAVIPLSVGTGRLEIRYVSFNTRGSDSDGLVCDSSSDCDPTFTICLRFRSTSFSFSCSSSSVTSPIITTGVYWNTNIVSFGSVIGGRTNPVSYSTDNFFSGQFEILIDVEDEDSIFGDDDIDRVYIRRTARASPVESSLLTFRGERSLFPTTASIRYRLICDPNSSGEFCTIVNNSVSVPGNTTTTTTTTPVDFTFFQSELFRYIIGGGSAFVSILVCLCIACTSVCVWCVCGVSLKNCGGVEFSV